MQPQTVNAALPYPTNPPTSRHSRTFTLTASQQTAFDALVHFLLDPFDEVFVLSGYSGTGKTTLIRSVLDHLPAVEKAARLVEPTFTGWDVLLTATTNKAAEAFSAITHQDVTTIHSVLGLRVHTDYKTSKTTLIATKGGVVQHGKLIFIDEASYIDQALLDYIYKLTPNSKIVFMGDPAQLAPVHCSDVPVFTQNCKKAHLSEVVRQAENNPIIALSTAFRNVVNGQPWFQFDPDNHHIQWLERSDFNTAMRDEFTDIHWHHNASKFLAWTNKCCIAHNQLISSWVKGHHSFEVNDYAICNKYLNQGGHAIKTDEMVLITNHEWGHDLDVEGTFYTLNKHHRVFVPVYGHHRTLRIETARTAGDYGAIQHIDETWADLRSVYACTVNKAQGSTYRKVFIDLDDIGKCPDPNQIARMLYVAVSRASEQVILTGDLV